MDDPHRSLRPPRVNGPAPGDRSDRASGASLDDLVRLAEGTLSPDRLAGAANRDRREGLYVAAEDLAGRPEQAGLRRTLIAGLQPRAKDAGRAIEGRGGGKRRSRAKDAVADPGVMTYVFVLGRLYHQVLQAEVDRLQRQDSRLEEATAHDIVDRAFTRVVLSPASDLTRGTGLIGTAVQRERLSHYRRAGAHRAASLDSPEHQALAGWLATQQPRVEEELAARQAAAALVRVASRLTGKRGVAIMTLIAAEGGSGIAAVARRLEIPMNTAKSLTAATRAEFRRRAEQDSQTRDAMRMFARRLDPRRRGSRRLRDDRRH